MGYTGHEYNSYDWWDGPPGIKTNQPAMAVWTHNDVNKLQSRAPVYDSVQLVQITPMSLWFMVPIAN